jgi:hypothetical protein
MNNYSIISGLLLVFLFSCSVYAGYANGHSCAINAECNSANCNMGYCCNSGQCGSHYGCMNEGDMPIGGSSSTACHNGSWMRAFGASCGSTIECAAGVCTTGFCCNVGQCGYSTSATGNCYDVGDTHNGQQCGADGIWKKQYAVSCTNDSECLTGNCNAGYCCNLGQCGSYYGCLNQGQCVPTSYCDSGCYNGTFKKYFGASCGSTSDCSSGTCINGFCCSSGQCGYSSSRTGNCYNIGDERYIYRCISEGTWRILNGYGCANNDDCVSNNCFYNTCSPGSTTTTTTASTTTTTMQCDDLWWFDDDTHFCGHKEFCGEYMYYGLKTFQNLSDCVEELNENYCVGEGNNTIIVPGAADCCVGLKAINLRSPDGSGGCMPPSTGAMVCALCGNGFCGLGENGCNCPADCLTTTTTTTTSSTTTTIPCEYLWWFDNSSYVCNLKEFCGQYMYYGLRTFRNQSGCLKELTGQGCIGEGNYSLVYPGAAQCCAGLTPLNPSGPGEFGVCNPPMAGASVCALCGNGFCGLGENECNCPQDCPCVDGISIDAYWSGSNDNLPLLRVLVDNKLKAEWYAVNMARKYDYDNNLSCGAHDISVAYSIPAQAQGTLSIYKIKAECTTLNAGDEEYELQSFGTLDFEYVKTRCSSEDACPVPGDTPVCGEITLSEVIDYISRWTNGEASLNDAINLINMWKSQG